MFRIIKNTAKHLYYGSWLNYAVAHIDRIVRSKKIEYNIKKRGDKILQNRSYVGTCMYSTELPKRRDRLFSCELHEGAYKFYALYTTQSMVDDLNKLSSANDLESSYNALMNALTRERDKWKNHNEL